VTVDLLMLIVAMFTVGLKGPLLNTIAARYLCIIDYYAGICGAQTRATRELARLQAGSYSNPPAPSYAPSPSAPPPYRPPIGTIGGGAPYRP
jgi:hypothetical protein